MYETSTINFSHFFEFRFNYIFSGIFLCVDVGTTISEIIEGLAAVTAENVIGKFFSLRPKSVVKLGQWLDSWIKIGKPLSCLMLK